jgi:hypothetical protein
VVSRSPRVAPAPDIARVGHGAKGAEQRTEILELAHPTHEFDVPALVDETLYQAQWHTEHGSFDPMA